MSGEMADQKADVGIRIPIGPGLYLRNQGIVSYYTIYIAILHFTHDICKIVKNNKTVGIS